MKLALPRMFRSLGNPGYRLWSIGALVSNTGTWVQRVAQNWLVLTVLTHHSASAVGVVMALQFGPQLLLLPLTGYAADHFDQRRLLMITQAVMGGLSLLLGILTVLHLVQLWEVYAFAFLFGSAAAFDAPVRQTFVADLVSREDLPNAVALNSTSFNAARMIGPAIAGLIIGATSTGWAFVLDAASFGAVLVTLFRLRPSESTAENHKNRRAIGGFTGGVRYVWRRPDLLSALIMLFLIGTFGLNFQIFTSTMAVKVFKTNAQGFGFLSSIMAIGTLVGALVAAGRDHIGFGTLLVGSAMFGVGCFLAAVAPGYWWFAAALVVIGVAGLTVMNASNSLVQLTTEPTMRGRVLALRLAVMLGGTPIGAPIVGWVADHYGPRWALVVGAMSGLAAAATAGIYLLWSRSRGAPNAEVSGHDALADAADPLEAAERS